MSRLFAVALAFAALTAARADTHTHVHAASTAAAAPPTPPHSSTNTTSTTDVTALRAALNGQVVGSSVAITNATLTTCIAQSWTFTHREAPYVSVHFRNFHILNRDTVTIATPDGTTTKRVDNPRSSATQFSSPRIPGPTAVVTFAPTGCRTASYELPRSFGLEIDAFEFLYPTAITSAGADGPFIESREICGASNQNRPAVCFKANASTRSVYTKARAVARLLKRAATAGGPQIACTGFLVGSAGHLITNHHCIKDATEANATTFSFMVQTPACESEAMCKQVGECAQFGIEESVGAAFVYANERLDYALVRLYRKPCVLTGKYGFFALRTTAPVVGEPIYVVQHPNGGAKMITMQQDVAKDDDEEDGEDAKNSTTGGGGVEQATVAVVNDENALGDFWTSYYADTESGSSGAPVVSLTTHTVVALHANGACKNSGTPSHLLVADMKQQKLDLPVDAFD